MAIWRRWRSPYLFYILLLLVLPLLLTVSDLHRSTISQIPRRNPSKKNQTILFLVQPLGKACLIAFNAMVSMPRSNVIILTDLASEFSVEKNSATILAIHGDYSRENLMLQKIRSYIAFLEQKLKWHPERLKCVNHYIFTDSDIAVVDNLAHIFQEYLNFHLALTFRNNKDQPLNSGFIAIKGSVEGILRAKTFLQEVFEVYSTKYMKASRMLGNQLALAWVIKSHLSFASKKFSRHEAFSGDMDGISVLFLPCAIYNWTPPEGAGQFHGMPLDVKDVHFKSSRKRLMLESWNFFNSTSNLSGILRLILASGRTKYDFLFPSSYLSITEGHHCWVHISSVCSFFAYVLWVL